MTARRERLVVLALGAVGAALALLAASRTWLVVTVKDPLAGSGRIHPDGRDVAALVPAAALVALAASVAAVTLRRVGRHVAGLLLVAAGAGIGSATVRVVLDPRAASEDVLRRATGRTGDVAAVAGLTGVWPWVSVLAAALVVLGGASVVVRGRSWSGLSGRYDAPGGAGPSGEMGAGPQAQATTGPDPGAGAPEGAAALEDTAGDGAWDALSRGEDPTR